MELVQQQQYPGSSVIMLLLLPKSSVYAVRMWLRCYGSTLYGSHISYTFYTSRSR